MKHQRITAERLREVLAYDPETGAFNWRVNGRGRFKRVGAPAGTVNHHGYVIIMIDGRLHQAHRLAWLHVHGRPADGEVDHRNTDRADNRFVNLRDVPPAVNKQNIRRARCDSRTGVLGVSPTRDGKFVAAVQTNGKQKYLGKFETASLGHAAYVAAKRELHEGCTI